MKVDKKINIGLASLRIYLSFLVVTTHCYSPGATIRKYLIIKNLICNWFHVPAFYIMSFYFSYKLFKSKDITKIKIRFQRLLIPYFIWPIIIWLLHNLISSLFVEIQTYTLNLLIFQLLLGNTFMIVLWFQYDLIFITLLIVIIHFLFNEKSIHYILINLEMFGIYFSYSNYNYILISNKFRTIGRICEIIPYCITGYIIASLNFVNIISKNKNIFINIFISILFLIFKYGIFLHIKGFLYQGFGLYFLSISIFLIFSIIPSIGNKYIIKLINIISIHTAGIYYIHLSLYKYLYLFSFFKKKTLISSLIIYFISFFVSLFGKVIFKKTKLIIFSVILK